MTRLRRGAAAVALAALGVLASVRLATAQCPDGTPPPCVPRQAPPSPHSIAVLYFDNLSRDSADTYIADGLTDEVIVRLQHVQRLDVKSRYEVRRFRGTRIADARSVGRELRVAYLVTGSVRPTPSRMRVTYELVRTSDGRAVASDIVDTTAADQWAISNGVALAIARAVAGRLAPEERAALVRSPSRDQQAVDLYRRGVFVLDRSFGGDLFDRMMCLAFFRAALERDSAFAEAWTAMADAFFWIGDVTAPNRWAAGQGRAAARRALALDSTSGKAAAYVAYAMVTVDYDWAGAEQLLRRGMTLDPRDAYGHLILSEVLAATGRSEEAWREVEAAWARDSLNPRLPYYVWSTLTCARRFDDLLHWAPRLGSWAEMAWFDGHLGARRVDSALTYAQRHPEWRVVALAVAGRLSEARDSAAAFVAGLDSARTRGERLYVNPETEAAIWAAVGDRDRAFAALERSYALRSGDRLPNLRCDPQFDALRDDPRYHDLLRRMHLEP